MSEEDIRLVNLRKEALLNLKKAPSQFSVLFHLLNTGKPLTVREISKDLNLTPKAAERAVAKLLEKKLIQRNLFKEGAYACDSKQILLALFVTIGDIQERLENQSKGLKETASS